MADQSAKRLELAREFSDLLDKLGLPYSEIKIYSASLEVGIELSELPEAIRALGNKGAASEPKARDYLLYRYDRDDAPKAGDLYLFRGTHLALARHDHPEWDVHPIFQAAQAPDQPQPDDPETPSGSEGSCDDRERDWFALSAEQAAELERRAGELAGAIENIRAGVDPYDERVSGPLGRYREWSARTDLTRVERAGD